MFLKFWECGPRNSQLDFRGDLHSDLEPGILFLIRLFDIALLYYRLLGVSTVVPTILSIVYQFNIMN